MCSGLFPNWTTLKAHIVGPSHRRLTVICPWCKGRERTFTRASDLKVHASQVHGKEEIDEELFSRELGFYFAKYPEDYVRLVDHVTKYEDNRAGQIRMYMRRWAESMRDGQRMMEELSRGWKAVDRISVGENEKGSGTRVVRSNNVRARSTESNKEERAVVEREKDEGELRRRVVRTITEKGDGGERQETGGEGRCDTVREDRRCEERAKSVDREEEQQQTRVGKRRGSTIDARCEGKRAKTIERDEGADDDGFDTYEDNVTVDQPEDGNESDSSSSSCSTTVRCSGLRERALHILMKGALPMCPPAPRDWAVVNSFDLEAKGVALSWPPKNFVKLSADQKLLAQEHLAYSIEEKTHGIVSLDRKTLYDKYRFLTLEGAAKPKAENHRKLEGRIRDSTYEFVKRVALGKGSDDKVVRDMIEMLEKSPRWKDTDGITNQLDEHSLRMKL